MVRFLFTVFLLPACIFFTDMHAQSNNKLERMQYFIENGDTVYMLHLEELTVSAKRKLKSRKDWRKYYRMVYNLPRVYPYVQIIKSRLAEMDLRFQNISGKKQRRQYIRQVEKEMNEKYKPVIKKFSLSQGKMMIKLINRETETTVYKIVKEMKGGFAALLWQGFAFIFSANLKSKFDGDGEDAMLENLIHIYEYGDYDSLYINIFGMGIEEHTQMLLQKKKK